MAERTHLNFCSIHGGYNGQVCPGCHDLERPRMRPPRMSEADVGALFLAPDGRTVYRMVGYADRPTARLQCVEDPERSVGGVVGAPIFNGYRRLVPDDG